MVIEGDQGRCLLAKARQLKERALGTPDRTRRKQFLLMATEYQKLARQEDDGIALNVVDRMVVPISRGLPDRGVVMPLRLVPRQPPAVSSSVPTRSFSRLLRAVRRPGIRDLMIWAFLVVISFGLLLAPGDQTTQGLQEVFKLFFE